MSFIETVISDFTRVASGAWEPRPLLSYSPEEAVRNTFTAAINFYLISYNEACRILSITRGDKFTGLPPDKRREIVLGLGQECKEDGNAFATRFKEGEPAESYQKFLSETVPAKYEEYYAQYLAAQKAVGNWVAFTNISPRLQVELPHHRICERWEAENIGFQTRFAQHLGILKPDQHFWDLEENPDVVVVDLKDKDKLMELQQQPAVVWTPAKADRNPYPAYIPYQGILYHFMNFPTVYGEAIRASVALKPNYLKKGGPKIQSINDALGSESAYPTITLEIDPKLILPE